jgi:putative membrane protein
MTHILVSWLILAASVGLTAAVLPGMKVRGFWGAIVAAAIFGLLNYFVGWLFFFGIGVATLGLGFLLTFVTRVLVNAILLKLTDAFTRSISVRGLGTAILGGLLIAVFGTAGEWLLQEVSR